MVLILVVKQFILAFIVKVKYWDDTSRHRFLVNIVLFSVSVAFPERYLFNIKVLLNDLFPPTVQQAFHTALMSPH